MIQQNIGPSTQQRSLSMKENTTRKTIYGAKKINCKMHGNIFYEETEIRLVILKLDRNCFRKQHRFNQVHGCLNDCLETMLFKSH